MSHAAKQQLEKYGWGVILFITVIGSAGALNHIFDGFWSTGDIPVVRSVNINLFGEAFFEHWLNFRTYPIARMSHMLPGLTYMLLAPFQFIPRIRSRYPKFHRINGRIVLILTIALIPSGMIFAFAHPYVGFREQVPTVFYTFIYLGCVAMGLRTIYRRRFAEHREWMIRVYAFGLGIYSIRVWYWLFLNLSDQPSTEFFATSFWIGIAANLVVAEIWINLSRAGAASAYRQSEGLPETAAVTTYGEEMQPRSLPAGLSPQGSSPLRDFTGPALQGDLLPSEGDGSI
jgi:uncharacterized membrane protein